MLQLKLTNELRGGRVTRPDWDKDQWVKVRYVGKSFAILEAIDGREICKVLGDDEDDWELFYPHIPLTDQKDDYDEDVA